MSSTPVISDISLVASERSHGSLVECTLVVSLLPCAIVCIVCLLRVHVSLVEYFSHSVEVVACSGELVGLSCSGIDSVDSSLILFSCVVELVVVGNGLSHLVLNSLRNVLLSSLLSSSYSGSECVLCVNGSSHTLELDDVPVGGLRSLGHRQFHLSVGSHLNTVDNNGLRSVRVEVCSIPDSDFVAIGAFRSSCC